MTICWLFTLVWGHFLYGVFQKVLCNEVLLSLCLFFLSFCHFTDGWFWRFLQPLDSLPVKMGGILRLIEVRVVLFIRMGDTPMSIGIVCTSSMLRSCFQSACREWKLLLRVFSRTVSNFRRWCRRVLLPDERYRCCYVLDGYVRQEAQCRGFCKR